LNCKTVKDLTDEYLDGMLSGEQKEEFESHLDTCPECTAFIQQMRQMLRFLSSMEEEELPEGFQARLNERLQAAAEEETSAAKGFNRFIPDKKWLKWGAGLAAAIVLLLSVRLVSQLGGLPGGNGALPDATTEQGSSQKLSLQAEMAEQPVQPQENKADAASDTAGEPAGGGAPEDADVPMMISAEAPEKSAAYDVNNTDAKNADVNNADENSKMNGSAEKSDSRSIMTVESDKPALSGELNLYIKDASVVLKKIAVIAASTGMTVTEEKEDAVVLQVTDEVQRTALYDGLAKLGRVEDLGIISKDDTVTVHIIIEK
jgi:hypothetical protein